MVRSRQILVIAVLFAAGACADSDVASPNATLIADATETAALILNTPYQVRSVLGSERCLSTGSQATSGSRATLAACGNDAAMIWVRPGTNSAMVGGSSLCLDVAGGVAQNGTPVQMWACDSTNANQRWTYTGGTLQWIGHDFCLNVVDGKAGDGARLQLWACNKNDANNRWTFKATSAAGAPGTTPAATPATPAATTPSGSGTAVSSGFVFSPYKDVGINTNWNTYAISTQVTGSAQNVLDVLPNVKIVSI